MSEEIVRELVGFNELKRRDKAVVLEAAQNGYLVTEPTNYGQQRVYFRLCRRQNQPAVEVHVRGNISDVYLRMETVVDPYTRKVYSYNSEYEARISGLVKKLKTPNSVEVNTTCVTGGPVTCITDLPTELAKRLAPVLLALGKQHAQQWLAVQAKDFRRALTLLAAVQRVRRVLAGGSGRTPGKRFRVSVG